MPTYQLKCTHCSWNRELFCSIADREQRIAETRCLICGSAMQQKITAPRLSFTRSEFPKGNWEHLGPEPEYIESESQLKDVCEERGLYSRLVEDGR